MNKNKHLTISILSIILLFVSCKRENPNVKYNDILVNTKNSIDNCFTSFNKQINNTLENQQYSLVSEYCKITFDSLNHQKVIVENIEYPANAKNFRNAFILYCNSLQNVVQSYNNYVVLSDESVTIEQLDSVNNVIKKAEKEIDKSLNNLLLRQMEFATKANLKLEYNTK